MSYQLINYCQSHLKDRQQQEVDSPAGEGYQKIRHACRIFLYLRYGMFYLRPEKWGKKPFISPFLPWTRDQSDPPQGQFYPRAVSTIRHACRIGTSNPQGWSPCTAATSTAYAPAQHRKSPTTHPWEKRPYTTVKKWV